MIWLIKELKAAGYRLTLVGEKIHLDFRGEGEPDSGRAAPLIEHLHQHKAEVLSCLKQQQLADTFEDRIRYARSWDELGDVFKQLCQKSAAGQLTFPQVERLVHLMKEIAHQLEAGLVNVPASAFVRDHEND